MLNPIYPLYPVYPVEKNRSAGTRFVTVAAAICETRGPNTDNLATLAYPCHPSSASFASSAVLSQAAEKTEKSEKRKNDGKQLNLHDKATPSNFRGGWKNGKVGMA